MGLGVPELAIAGLFLSAAGTVASVVGQRQARKQQQRQFERSQAAQARAEALQNRRADITAARQRRRAAAEARRFRATGVNLAAIRGAGGALGAPGSTVPGISGNIQSQLNFNNAFINQVTTLNQGIRSAFSEASAIRSRPITAGANWTAFGQVASAAGSLIFTAARSNLFKDKPNGGEKGTVSTQTIGWGLGY